ncbi:MAG: DegV family protein [Oscillospiraceae bacterium]|nr:DegV family protein [Oscillospiraceae bacterium]
MKILFVTDSSSDVPRELIEGKPVVVVPSKIIVSGKEYRDFHDLTHEKYWEILKTTPEVPTTAAASPGDYLDVYRKARDDGYTHICVTQISSTASATMNNALIARKMLEEEGVTDMTIEVIDTLNYTMTYGHTVLEGIEMADKGFSFDKIVERMRELCHKAEVVFSVFTLKYLRRTGRASGMAAFAGELLGIRPVMLGGRGEVKPVSKVRGDKNVVDGIVEYVKKRKNSAETYMSILYSDISKEVVAKLEYLLERNFGLKNLPKYKLGAAITSHTGPFAVGVVFYT